MKQLLTTFTLLMMVALAMAVPAKRGVWKTLKLNDGTEVRVQLVGDEHAHFWVSEDGKTYIQTGWRKPRCAGRKPTSAVPGVWHPARWVTWVATSLEKRRL